MNAMTQNHATHRQPRTSSISQHAVGQLTKQPVSQIPGKLIGQQPVAQPFNHHRAGAAFTAAHHHTSVGGTLYGCTNHSNCRGTLHGCPNTGRPQGSPLRMDDPAEAGGGWGMSFEWPETTLGGFVRLQRGHDLTASEQQPGPYSVMGSAGPNGSHNVPKAKGPGVVVGRSGASMGRVHYSESDYWPHNTCLYVTDFLGNNPRFAYYVLSTLDLAGFNSGSAQPSLNRNYIYGLPLRIPHRLEQDAIVEVLSALDDRIALLRDTNATLEAIAQALFKSWFVDFDPVHANVGAPLAGAQPTAPATHETGRAQGSPLPEPLAALFPDSFEESPLGLVPRGWRVKQCQDIIDVRDGTHASPKPSETGYPLVTSRHITSGHLSLDDTYLISEAEFVDISKRSKVDHLDVLITMIGTVGIPAFVLSETTDFAIKNIGLFKTSKRPDFSGYIYLLLKSKEMQHYLEARMAGTTQKYLSLKALREIAIIEPSPEVIAAFAENVQPIFEKMHRNSTQAQTLATLRDTLLPRLISGQLRLPEAESLPEEVSV